MVPRWNSWTLVWHKDSSLLLHAIHNLSTSGFSKKTRRYQLWFKKCIQTIRWTRKLESIRGEHFVQSKDEGRKPDKNSSLRRLEFKPKNLDNKCRSRIPSLLYFFLFSAFFLSRSTWIGLVFDVTVFLFSQDSTNFSFSLVYGDSFVPQWESVQHTLISVWVSIVFLQGWQCCGSRSRIQCFFDPGWKFRPAINIPDLKHGRVGDSGSATLGRFD